MPLVLSRPTNRGQAVRLLSLTNEIQSKTTKLRVSNLSTHAKSN